MTGAVWAILGVSIALMGVLSFLIVRLTVTVSRTSSNALASLIALDQRHSEQVRSLVDRLMAQDWEAVRLHEGAEETEEGGFIEPEEEHTVHYPAEAGLWARASSAQERAAVLDEVAQLADEDDLDDYHLDRSHVS